MIQGRSNFVFRVKNENTYVSKGLRGQYDTYAINVNVNIVKDDITNGGCALVSCFISEPEFVGQTKDRLATVEATKLVENSIRDHFDNWLASDNKAAGAILDYLILRSEERLRRRQEKETGGVFFGCEYSSKARQNRNKGFQSQRVSH